MFKSLCFDERVYTWAMNEVKNSKTKRNKSLIITGVISFVVSVLFLFVARYLASNYILPASSSIDWWYKFSQNAGHVFFWLGLLLIVIYIISIVAEKFNKQ
jgi:SNF family Na+-dependent transporter